MANLAAMFQWFSLSPFVLTIGAVTGLWVVLICSPLLRHTFWFFSALGRRNPNFTPRWTLEDFDNHLTFLCGWWGTALAYLMECRACQSVWSGLLATICYSALCGLSWWIGLFLWPLFIAVFYYIFNRISHV